MIKWEYKVVHVSASFMMAHHDLNKLGSEGWEMAAMCYGAAYFKRPVEKTELTASELTAAEMFEHAGLTEVWHRQLAIELDELSAKKAKGI